MKRLQFYALIAILGLGSGNIFAWGDEPFKPRREEVTRERGRDVKKAEDARALKEFRFSHAYTDTKGIMKDSWHGVKKTAGNVAGTAAHIGTFGFYEPTPESHASEPDYAKERAAEDEKATKRTDDLEADIEQNITERAKFKNLVMDREAYKREMRRKIDDYTNDIADKIGLDGSQKAELKRALSEGLMKNPEKLYSIGRMIGKGVAVTGGFAWDFGAGMATGGIALAGGSATVGALAIDARGTDARAFDYRSTSKRLADVVTKPPFDILDTKLKLNDDQKRKLDNYRDAVVGSLHYQVREVYDDVRHTIAKLPYDAARKGVLLGVTAIVLAIVLATILPTGVTH